MDRITNHHQMWKREGGTGVLCLRFTDNQAQRLFELFFSLTLQQLFTSDFYPQAVNTQGKEAFAKELPMENKGMRFQKLFFLTFL